MIVLTTFSGVRGGLGSTGFKARSDGDPTVKTPRYAYGRHPFRLPTRLRPALTAYAAVEFDRCGSGTV